MALLAPWWIELTAVLVTLASGIYLYFSICFLHWKRRGIPYIEPSFPFGNVKDMATFKTCVGESFEKLYYQSSADKMVGFYQMQNPALLVRDPDLVKTFLVKDFSHFHDRGLYFDEKRDPITGHLFFLEGTRWRHLRHKLTPTFTSGKMKMMFPAVVECSNELVSYLQTMATNREIFEIKEVLSKFTTDVIATCAFGIKSNSLSDPNSEFRRMGRKIFNPTWLTNAQDMITFLAPPIARIFNIPSVPRHISSFFRDVVNETVHHRENHNVSRDDFIQLLINIKNKKSVYDGQDLVEEDGGLEGVDKNMYDIKGMSVDEIAAQAFVFFMAGFETSSTTMSFCLYELAVNPTIQERVRDEVDSVTADHGGKLTYEGVQQMQYLDNVVSETLRKYPPVPTILRNCNNEYQLPGTQSVMSKGTPMVVPVYALHHDPQYYPDPAVFDPDRFTEAVKSKRHQYVYLPFGEGPRICIGSRFGLMQTKVGLASLLMKYQFNVSKDTAVPLVLDPRSFVLSAAGGIHLDIANRLDAES